MRRFSVVVLSALLMLALASSAALAERPAGKGKGCDGCDSKEKGQPANPSGFGGAASQVATDKTEATGTPGKGGLGEHSSSQEEPRQGVGNVARTDDAEGDHPGDHGCFVGQQMNVDCNDKPGKGGK